MPAFTAPDVGQQQLLGVRRHSGPKLGSRAGEFGDGFDVHDGVSLAVRMAESLFQTDCKNILFTNEFL